jgi:hypothetical protein
MQYIKATGLEAQQNESHMKHLGFE